MRTKQSPKKAVSKTASRPAPVGGLNGRDSIAAMPLQDAIALDNWFPGTTNVALRNGYENHATGLPAWVETIMPYSAPTSRKLFAISDGEVYDVTSSGAVGAAVVTGLSNSRWEHVNFGTAGGQFLYAVNGLDSPLLYDGTNWTSITGASTPAITGVTTSNLSNIAIFKNRVWFVEKESFKVWYLPVNSVGGAASSINFAPLFKMGGSLVAMVTWTIDNTNGIDDYAAFLSSEGEIALYRGTDPDFASTWFLVGMFRVGTPVGKRCHMKMGGDAILITSDGLISLKTALLADRSQRQKEITDKIRNLINQDITSYRNAFGWQVILHPIGNKLVLNVPQNENSRQYQYVMNTITKAWCTFGKLASPWNAACFEVQGDDLYWGGNTVVALADTGFSDNGANITGDAKQSFSYFGDRARIKVFKMSRPVLYADGNINAALAMNVDFEDKFPTSTPTFSGSGGPPWNTTPWNTSPWGGAAQVRKNWQTTPGIGYCASLRMKIACNAFTPQWLATDYVYELGGVL